MKLVSIILISAALLRGETLNAEKPDPGQLRIGTAWSNGREVQMETRLEPDSPSITKHGGGVLGEREVIKRHVCNFDNQTFFGYDLTVEPLQNGMLRLRFAPLSMTAPTITKLYPEVKKWKPLTRPSGAPATLDVRAGDTVALDLFVNRSTGQKVTEYLTVKPKR
jgi:hypothetical protein